MKRTFFSVEDFSEALNQAIDITMQTTIAENVMEDEARIAKENVYDSYTPKFNSRRMENGGLMDIHNMFPDYDPTTKTLTVTNQTPWQEVGFRYVDGSDTRGNSLVEVIQTTQVYNAPARSFIPETEEDYRHIKFGEDLVKGLRSQGF